MGFENGFAVLAGSFADELYDGALIFFHMVRVIYRGFGVYELAIVLPLVGVFALGLYIWRRNRPDAGGPRER